MIIGILLLTFWSMFFGYGCAMVVQGKDTKYALVAAFHVLVIYVGLYINYKEELGL